MQSIQRKLSNRAVNRKRLNVEPLLEKMWAREKGDKEVESIIIPLLRPQNYSTQRVQECAHQIKTDRKVNRRRIFRVLHNLGIEPVEARETKLGEIAPDLLPLRSIAEAWAIVVKNESLLQSAINGMLGGFIGKLPFKDIWSIARLRMFESVLYWDPDRGNFSTYLFATIPGCRRAIYEEIRRKQKEVKFSEFDEDGEEPDRYEVAPLWAVDQTTKEKMDPMQEEVVDAEERKKAIADLFKKAGLTAREEKVLRLCFGLSALSDCMVAEKPVLSPREEAKVRMLEGKLLRELVPRRFSSKGKP